MISPKIGLISVVCLLPLLGCDAEAPSEELTPRTGVKTGPLLVPGEIIAECAGACPTFAQWDSAPLFDASPWIVAQGVSAPGPLASFQRYTWAGELDVTEADQDVLLGHPGFVEANVAVRGVSPQSDPLTEAAAPLLRDITEWKYQAVDPGDVAGTNAQRAEVHVAIVDTEPSGALDGPAIHGRAMAAMAEAAACPEGPAGCAVKVVPVVGLPRFADGTIDFEGGGFSGTPGDIAVGTFEAVERWLDANVGVAVPSRLVINLSLGLDSDVFTDVPASKNALLQTLRYAHCHGALIVAAAGNDEGLGTEGALWPAELETVWSPTPGQCSAAYGLTPPNEGASYRPLLHSVGSLALDPGLGPSTREGSMPRLAGPGTHTVTPDLEHVLTGSSVAASTTAGVAALALSYNPSLSRGAVMQLVHDHGGVLPGQVAEHYLGGGAAPAVRRVRACATLEAACAQPGALCGGVDLDCFTGNVPGSAEVHALLDAVPAPPAESTDFDLPAQECEAPDGTLLDTFFQTAVSGDCGSTFRDPLSPLTHPQPGTPGCSVCGFESASGLTTLALEEELRGYTVDSATLTLVDFGGTRWVYHLGPLTLDPDSVHQVDLAPASTLPATVRSASLTMQFAEGNETEDTLVLN